MPIDHTISTDQHRLGAAERALTSIQWVPALNCEGLVWQPPLGQQPTPDDHLSFDRLRRDNDALIAQINEKAARIKALETQIANIKCGLAGA